jgi:hypothetical protein
LSRHDSVSLPVSGDAFRTICTHVFWCNARPGVDACFRHGDVVFCKIDEVWRLFKALRRTRKRVVLVTGEGDKPVDRDLWRHCPPHVAAWFGTNMEVEGNSRVCGLPLGLGNADGRKTLSWDEIRAVPESAPERNRLLYANFSAHSNPAVREPLRRWLNEPAQNWITRSDHDPDGGKASYLQALRSHRFVLCPPGNGVDTHRFWEALYCGAVPVIRRSVAMNYFTGLPVVLLDDLREVTPRALHDHPSSRMAFDDTILRLDYWRDKIMSTRARIAGTRIVSWGEWMAGWRAEISAACR